MFLKIKKKYDIKSFFLSGLKFNLLFIAPLVAISFFIIISFIHLKNENERIDLISNQVFFSIQPSLQIDNSLEIYRIGNRFFEGNTFLKEIVILRKDSRPVLIGNPDELRRSSDLKFSSLILNKYLRFTKSFYIYPDMKEEVKLKFKYLNHKRGVIFISTIVFTAFLGLIILLQYAYVYRFSIININRPFLKLLEYIKDFDRHQNKLLIDEFEKNIFLKESLQIFSTFNSLQDRLDEQSKKLIVLEREKAFSQVATQVAHDRSPLTALDSAMKKFSDIKEDERITIRNCVHGIRDIANNLLQSYRMEKIGEKESSVHLLSPLIDSIVSQKRLQFRSNLNYVINSDLGESSYGLFVKIFPNDLQRILSNLINNSIDSFGNKGKVNIGLYEVKDEVIIDIIDNGKGISKNYQNNIFNGKSFGKKEGNGIALKFAKETIESWGGRIRLNSDLENGTKVTISLPKANIPTWFVSSLKIKEKSNIIILDDDPNIHGVWARKFEELNLNSKGLSIINLTDPAQIKGWVNCNSEKLNNSIFLCDYEIIDHNETGLDLIEELKLDKFGNSYLVTSHYEDLKIKERCKFLGVKIIPKSMACFVPINLIFYPSLKSEIPEKGKYDIVHIENNDLIRNMWIYETKKIGKLILSLSCPNEMENFTSDIGKNCKFYIDQDLGEDKISGVELAKYLYKLGFRNLVLSTGLPLKKLEKLYFLKAVCDKNPPWKKRVSLALP